jgi:hypothetical protein
LKFSSLPGKIFGQHLFKGEKFAMPRITTYGVPVAVVKKISRAMVDELAQVTSTPREHFSLRVNCDVAVFDGAEIAPDAFVEVCLFERGDVVEDRIAGIVTRHLQEAGFSSVEVYLTQLLRRKYFENGQHY